MVRRFFEVSDLKTRLFFAPQIALGFERELHETVESVGIVRPFGEDLFLFEVAEDCFESRILHRQGLGWRTPPISIGGGGLNVHIHGVQLITERRCQPSGQPLDSLPGIPRAYALREDEMTRRSSR